MPPAWTQAQEPAGDGEEGRLGEEQPEDLPAQGAEGAQKADLVHPFVDGDGHDGEDAHRPHQQGDAAQGAHGEGDHAQDLVQHGQLFLLGDHGEILGPVAPFQEAANGPRQTGFVGARPIDDVDLHEPFTVEQGHRPGHGDVDRIVQIHPQDVALGGHEPDDPVTLAPHPHPGPQGAHLAPEHHERPGRAGVVGGQEAPRTRMETEGAIECVADPEDGGTPGQAIPFHLGVALNDGDHRSHLR